MSKNVYEIITNEIVKKLEKVNPNDWEKPWFNIGISPFNAISKKDYRGINYLTLGNNGHESKAYASYKQWQDKDCQVKKGEKSHIAVFWKLNEYENNEGENKKSLLLRYYRVFNSEQVEGDYARKVEQEKLAEMNNHDPIACAETLVDNYLANERLQVQHSDKACYARSLLGEHIEMPALGQFKDAQSYYAVFLHEMTHSTGAENRLNRDMSGGFGSKAYAKEELVAELGAAMLSGSIGLTQKPRIDHAQYIASWLRELKNDQRFVVSAASQAQKAADFIQESAANYREFSDTQLIAAE